MELRNDELRITLSVERDERTSPPPILISIAGDPNVHEEPMFAWFPLGVQQARDLAAELLRLAAQAEATARTPQQTVTCDACHQEHPVAGMTIEQTGPALRIMRWLCPACADARHQITLTTTR